MDRELARRIERAEGAIGTSFIAVQDRLAPALGAAWRDFDGTYALYVGADSPMTQTFGLGMVSPVTAESLAEIEAPIELSSVLVMPLADREVPVSSRRREATA